MMNEERLYKMFKDDHPETVGETDQCFDTDNYKDWLQNYVGKLEAKLLTMKLNERKQSAEVSDNADSKALSTDDVGKRIFAIKDTSGEWIKLCATKETAESELLKYKKQHNYADFYIDEETLY